MTEPFDRSTESELGKAYRRESFWLDTVDESLDPLPSLEEDLRCDVAIVGAGFAGLWTAYFLKRHAPDLEVVMLEKEIAGFGASGRNGGACSAWWEPIFGWFRDPGTRDAAIRLHRRLIDAIPRIGEIAEAEGFDCGFAPGGLIMTADSEDELQQFAKAAHVMAKCGFAAPDYELLDEVGVRDKIAVEGARGGLFTPHAAAVQPARLARGLAKAVRAKGVRIFERSPARALEPGLVKADRGVVRAQTVLMAAEAYVSKLAGFRRQLAPIHSWMLATAPLDDSLREAIGLSRPRSFGMTGDGYGQLTADGRIAFGARGTYHFGSRISKAIGPESRETRRVRERLLECFPALHSVPVTHGWGGPMGFARDERPFVFLDDARCFGWAGGLGPAGVAPSCIAGETLADLVLGLDTPRVDDPWVVSALPPVWEPEPLRWVGITGVKIWRELSPF
jgi:glycine/D-amino acid oxidase-like deaminating enzyme